MQALVKTVQLLSGLKVKCMRVLGRSIRHQCDGLEIELPPGHLLPLYHRKHPQYDRFLPFMVRHLGREGLVIDVGANVGDTLASMVASNPHLDYVCVEPDDEFFCYLERNANRVRDAFDGIHVTLVKELIGCQMQGVSLEGKNGTRTIVQGAGGSLVSKRLDAVVKPSLHGSVRLLKSDVDGFDADVIQSADAMLRASRPILYFEMHHVNEAQKQSFIDLLAYAKSLGYDEWVVFDNFGAKLLRTHDLDALSQLIHYVHLQNAGVSTRTMFYFDVLSFSSRDAGVVDSALRDHALAFA